MRRDNFLPLRPKSSKMVTELLVVWVIGVVSFFALWAILLKVIKRISEKKNLENLSDQPSEEEPSNLKT